MLLFIILVLVFTIPAVQTSVAHKITETLNEDFDVNINLKKIRLSYNGQVVLDEVYIADHHKDTLISAQKIETSLANVPALFSGKQLDLGNVNADHLKLRIRHYKGEESDNISIFADKFDDGSPRSEHPFEVYISHISAIHSELSYEDLNQENPEIISLENLAIEASDLHTQGPNVSIDLENLKAETGRGISISKLKTNFSYSLDQMSFNGLELETPNSDLKADIAFNYDDRSALGDFENKVVINAKFEKSVVSTNDLKLLYNEFGENQQLSIQGDLAGTLNDFDLANFEFRGMDRSVIQGDLNLKNMLSTDNKTFKISGNVSQLSSNYYDLKNLLPTVLGKSLPEQLQEIGSINLQGYISATPTQVITKSNVSTELGNAQLDVRLDKLNTIEKATYKGNLVFKDFNLGKLVGNPSLGLTTFNLDVDGVGFSQEALNTQLKGKIKKLRFNGYTYKDITVLGILKNPLFNGKLICKDPNFQFEFNGLADMSKSINVYDFKADVLYADLHKLNFVDRDSVSIFKGKVTMNMKGTGLDDAKGEILLQDASYKNQQASYAFEEMKITSGFEGEKRTITVNSPDIISGKLVGRFYLEDIPALFENAIGSLYTNYRPKEIAKNQYLDFDFDIYSKIVEVIFPEMELAPNTFIRGSVESKNSEFKLTFRSPKIAFFDNMFQNVNLQVDNTNPLFNTYLQVDSIATSFYNFSKVNLINVTINDTLFVRSEFKGGKDNNDDFNLSFYHTINKDNKSVIGIRKSDIKFKKSKWYLNEENDKSNVIVFDNQFKDFKLDTLVLSHKDQQIRLSGKMRDSTYKNFKLNFVNVDLDKITPDIDSLRLQGKVNGKLDLLQEKGVYYPRSTLAIDSVAINDISYGNLKMNIKGNESLTHYNIDALLGNETQDFLKAKGSIDVDENNPNIDLGITLDKFRLGSLSALGGDVISNIRGLASGKANIRGNYKSPEISGKITLAKAGLKIPYLNIDLNLQDDAIINLTKQQFVFDHIGIEDTKYHTKGTLNGTISHHNFSEWELDLGIDAPDRLAVLDTEADEDALYYGTAFISGSAKIKGPADELIINVNATTEKGTIFKIPLNDTEAIGDNSFIYFLSPKEKLAKEAGKEIKIKEVKGLELFFDLDVTSDAEVEVVVDKNSGSTLRGSGAGTLLMEINTNGKFNMWGDFVVYEGVYNFKYAGLVQKEFEVVPGGSINWDGSPTRANLNVRALYKTNANPAILLENPTINRNIPVNVYINLNGELEETDISFDIEYPNLSSVVKSELEYRISDRQNTELQALSLITQGSFYSQYATGQNAPGNLLFERASGLFDDIFSDDDGKFKVGIDYVQGDRTPDQDTADRFGVTLSTQISKRVLINGKVGVPIGGVSESVVVGNVEIELLLNKEGTLRANLFNRENNIQYIGEELGYTQGVGLSYSVDFDTFKELIHKILNKEMKVEDIPEEVEEGETAPEESLAPDYIEFPGEE